MSPLLGETFPCFIINRTQVKREESRPRRDEGDDPLRVDLTQTFII